MTTILSQVEVVAWLRKQSQAYSDAADLIEGTDGGSILFTQNNNRFPSVHSDTTVRIVNGHRATFPALSVQALRDRLARRSARAGDLAKEFGVAEAEIMARVNSDGSGIKLADRGWLKLEGQPESEELLPKG